MRCRMSWEMERKVGWGWDMVERGKKIVGVEVRKEVGE